MRVCCGVVTCHRIFEELEDYRAFELLRNQTMRADYLLTKQVPPPTYHPPVRKPHICM